MKGVTHKKFTERFVPQIRAIRVHILPYHIIAPSIQLFTPKMVSLLWLFVNSGFLCFAHGWQTRESGEMSGVGF